MGEILGLDTIDLLVGSAFISFFIVPALLIFWVAFTKGTSRLYRISLAVWVGGALIGMNQSGGSFVFASFWPKLFLALFVLAALRTFLRSKNLPLLPERKWKPLLMLVVVGTLAFGTLVSLFQSLKGENLSADISPLELQFPLKGGTFGVLLGGSGSSVTQQHEGYPQKFATDLVKLGPRGLRAQGVLPKDLSRYYSFGEPVYAPCSGEILGAVSNETDDQMFVPEPQTEAGNYVLLYCEKVTVLLAHLQQDSVLVKEGDLVEAGQPVGKVGSSGKVIEPQLRIQAGKGRISDMGDHFQTGQPVPLTFNGKILSSGDIVKVP